MRARPDASGCDVRASADVSGAEPGTSLPDVWPGAALVCVLVVAVYFNTLKAEFTLDDVPIVQENALITDLGNLPKFFTTNYWGENPKNPDKSLYRPLTVLSYALNYAIHGLEPAGYHLVNMLLHAAVSLLLYLLVLRLIDDVLTALIAGILFAVHPVHTEVVAGIVGRAEIMALLGTLTCCLAYDRATRATGQPGRRPHAAWMVLAVAGYAFGIFSKEIGIVAPAVILLWEIVLPQKRSLLRARPAAIVMFAGFAIVVTCFLILRAGAVRSVSQNVGFVGVGPLDRIWTALRVCLEYVGLLLMPVRLSADYWVTDVPIARGITEPGVLGAIAVLLLMLITAAWSWRRCPAIAVGITFFLVSLFPVSNIPRPIGVMKAERLLYTPSAGLLLAIAAGLALLCRHSATKRFVIPMIGLVVMVLSIRTWQRNYDWRDNRTLAEVTLRTSPDSVIFNTILATSYREQRDNVNARRHLERALAGQPDNLTSLFNLGNIELDEGNFDRAVELYRRALAIQPDYLSALNNLGRALSEAKRFEEAVVVLEKSRALRPDSPAAYVNLLSIHIQTRNLVVAEPLADEALRRFPGVAAVFWNAGSVYRMVGREAEAERILSRAKELEGGRVVSDVRTNLD